MGKGNGIYRVKKMGRGRSTSAKSLEQHCRRGGRRRRWNSSRRVLRVSRSWLGRGLSRAITQKTRKARGVLEQSDGAQEGGLSA